MTVSTSASVRSGLRARSLFARLLLLGLSGLLLAAAAGCVTPSPPPAAGPPEAYRAGAPDQLEVSVLPDPAIERSAKIRPDGKISIDLIGDVHAAGRTTQEIANEIQQRIGRYKRNASVTVSVAEAQSNTISIFSAEGGGTTIPLQKETRVAEAIAASGGTTILARRNKVRVIRTDGETTTVFRVRMADILRGDLSTNLLLMGGDIVVVPPSVLARIGFVMQQLLFPVNELIGGAGSGAAAAALI